MDTLPQLTELTKRQLELLCQRERITNKMYQYANDIAAVDAIDQELIEIEKDKAEERRLKWASKPDEHFLKRRWHFESDTEFYESVRKLKPKSLLLPENQVEQAA